jgi:hypothetical protein
VECEDEAETPPHGSGVEGGEGSVSVRGSVGVMLALDEGGMEVGGAGVQG